MYLEKKKKKKILKFTQKFIKMATMANNVEKSTKYPGS